MMRYFTLSAIAFVTFTFFAVSAYATDDKTSSNEFGSSFSNQAPAALKDNADDQDNAAALADMEPAAGDEAATTVETAAQVQASKQANAIQPEAGQKSDEERELGERFNTDVTRTEFDRGDGNVRTHDRMGNDKIGVYYETNKDEKLNDSNDTIGVNIKLLEFK